MTLDEALLRDAAMRLMVPGARGEPSTLCGWTTGPADTLPEQVRYAIIIGLRMPRTYDDVYAELHRWQRQNEPGVWIRARMALLVESLAALETAAR